MSGCISYLNAKRDEETFGLGAIIPHTAKVALELCNPLTMDE
jgi:hypothetical protein